MTLLAAHTGRRGLRGRRRHGHLVPIALAGVIAAGALAAVAWLLWPTWEPEKSSDPSRLPVSVGGTLFNVPTAAVRRNVQRHSGPQERVDLSFSWPALEPTGVPTHAAAEASAQVVPPIDRLFVSIAAHHDTLAPDVRVRTIYPRYFEKIAPPTEDGLLRRAFREGTPYGNEDLFVAAAPALAARCTRDATTPGMCISERRFDGADLTFRFPRAWLKQWREVAAAMEKLSTQLRGPKGS